MLDWYAGIKQAYKKYLKKLPLKLRSWIVLMRPFTLLLPLCGGWFLIQGSLGINIPTPDIIKTLLALLTLMMINAGGNVVNAACDIEIDRINKPYRPTCTGLISREEAMAVGISLMFLAMFLGSFVNYMFNVLCVLMMILTFIYSVPPIRLKKRFLINNLSQAVVRGFLGVLAAWSIYGVINPMVIAMGIVLSSFIVSAQASKDISDLPGDRKYNVKTFPVVFGLKRTQKIMTYMAPIPFVLLISFVSCGIFPVKTLWGLLLLPIVLLIPKATIGEEKLENTLGWVLFYVTMMVFLLLFAFTL